MNIQCPQCRSMYRVDPDRVPPGGVRARCSRCGEVMAVMRPGAAPAPALATQHVGAAAGGEAAATQFRAGAVPPPAGAAPEPVVPPAAAAAPVRPDPVRPEPSLDRPGQHGREEAGAPAPAASGGPPRPAGVTRGVSRAAASDPDARARRIARALVSDIVVYHKERCERSLQMGTLRTEFKEEILKSWEEYVQQVGLELARSTPYFRDALNEILAKGQKVF